MAIGIVSSDDFEIELNKLKSHNSNSPIQSDIEPTILHYKPHVNPEMNPEIKEKGRGENNVEVPDTLRKLIGETPINEGRRAALQLAEQFDISPSSVSAYTHGSTSTASYNSPDSDLNSHIKSTKQKLAVKAKNRLLYALNAITEEKLKDVSVKVASEVAKNMSAIMKDMEPPAEVATGKNQPQFIIYAPKVLKENAFDVIHVKE